MAGNSFRVPTRDLRNALKAVLPHADRTKTGGDQEGTCHRVRLSFGRELVVMATNLTTTAVGIVPFVTEDGRIPDAFDLAGEDGKAQSAIVDITPRHARMVISLFKASPTDPDGVAQEVQLTIHEDGLEILDVSGLFAGDSYDLRHVGNGAGFPDVWGITGRAVHSVSSPPSPKPLVSLGKVIGMFTVASAAYETELSVEATGAPESRGFLVSCGPRFLGTLSSTHNDDDSLAKRDAARRAWLARFSGKQLKAV